MALAAEQAGAVALRIEGIENLKATRAVVSVPIIGILKRDLADSPVRITAFLEDVDALAQAGADIIAIDGTDRVRPVPVAALLARIHHHQVLAMAGAPRRRTAWPVRRSVQTLLALRFRVTPRQKPLMNRIWRW